MDNITAAIISGSICLGLGYGLLLIWPKIQALNVVKKRSDAFWGRLSLTACFLIFVSLLLVQNNVIGGTDWKFVVPYLMGCLGLCISGLGQFNAGAVALNGGFVFMMIYSLLRNSFGIF